eukprot:TRINITY_DN25568_c0_g1_i1.p1 TRINITY_DN25568_c0_g1~~TRINITY_DN25568_c0_g1_i1.p1  ORF type:complete len:730 (+),score=196.65 TRINITY_DN25568_c0_g1_i1:54-2243(+)
MGVPALFHWLLYRFPRAITAAVKLTKHCDIRDEMASDVVKHVDCLYFDLNSVIHNACHGNSPLPPDATEDDMICRIFEQIDSVIGIVNPKKLVYIAIDGTVPCSKLLQQRARRFQNDERDAGKWDSNVISPGTTFMKKVADALTWYVYDRQNTDEDMRKLAIILSDSQVSGEGEHKIMNYIHQLRVTPGYDPNTSHCIVAQDADLILLGLATHIPHFYLLREHQSHFRPPPGRYPAPRHHLAVKPGWDFVDLGAVREYLSVDYDALVEKRGANFENVIDDFVLLCMLMGNDFLPSIPTIYVKEGALDELLTHYKHDFKGHLIENTRIRYDRLALILQHFGRMEDKVFAARHHFYTRECTDSFSFKTEDYRRKYRDQKLQGDDLGVARAYLQGLQWCMDYYFTGDCSWEWHYGYNFPPLVTALAYCCIEFQAVPHPFAGAPPLQPLESLMAILPRSSNEALPATFRELAVAGGVLDDLYAAEPVCEKIAGRTIVITPPIDVPRLKRATRNPAVQAKLTPDESSRNTFNAPLAFVHLDLLPTFQYYALYPSDVAAQDGEPVVKKRKMQGGFPPPTDGIAAMLTALRDTHPKSTPIGGTYTDEHDMFDPVEANRVVCVEIENAYTHKHTGGLLPDTDTPMPKLQQNEKVHGSQTVFRNITNRLPADAYAQAPRGGAPLAAPLQVPQQAPQQWSVPSMPGHYQHSPPPMPTAAVAPPAAAPAIVPEEEEEEFF